MHPRTYRVAAGIALAVSLCVAVIAGYVSILVVDVIGVLAVPGVSGATVSRKCGKRVAPTFRRTTPCFWCGRRDSNPHEGCPSAVFKSMLVRNHSDRERLPTGKKGALISGFFPDEARHEVR
jgi:hypothetical protein